MFYISNQFHKVTLVKRNSPQPTFSIPTLILYPSSTLPFRQIDSKLMNLKHFSLVS